MARDTAVIQPVRGLISPSELGVTMCHEHLLFDARWFYQEPGSLEERALRTAPVSMELLGWLQFNPESNLDNLVLDDEDVIVDEVLRYRNAGGRSLVDCTVTGLGRDPAALKRISDRTDTHVVMGSGYYVAQSHPTHLASMSAEDVAREIIADVRRGVAGTEIRAGLIGEIASSWPMADEEVKVFRGAGMAQAELGCALSVHPGRNPDSPRRILPLLREAGADLRKVIIGHIERTVQDLDGLRALAAQGCYLQFDLFGTQVTGTLYRRMGIVMPSDAQRLTLITGLIGAGHGSQILVSHDICTKNRTRHFGGIGYDHFLSNVVPWMTQFELDDDALHMLTITNPQRALALRSAPP